MFTAFFADLSFLMMKATFATFLVEVGIFLTIVFAIIGVIETIVFFVNRGKKKKSKDPYKEWIKTGKM